MPFRGKKEKRRACSGFAAVAVGSEASRKASLGRP